MVRDPNEHVELNVTNCVHPAYEKIDIITLSFGFCFQCGVLVKLCLQELSNCPLKCTTPTVVFVPKDVMEPIK